MSLYVRICIFVKLQLMSFPFESGTGVTFWPEYVSTAMCPGVRICVLVKLQLMSFPFENVGLTPDFNPNLPPCPNCPIYLQEGHPYTFITQVLGQAIFPSVFLPVFESFYTSVFLLVKIVTQHPNKSSDAN